MKRILTILAGLLLAASVQAANFTAAAAGNWHTTNTWGVTSVPGATDNVDLNGQAVTITGTVTCASLVDAATGGSLDFVANASFTCRAVTNVPLSTSAAGVVLDCDYMLTTSFDGLTINPGGEVTIAGTWANSGDNSVVNNVEGTVTDFSGTLNNSGSGYGVFNYGTMTDFTGTLNNSGDGYGVFNSGGTVTDFSGTLNNIGTGYGAYNASGTWTDFSGVCLDSGSGKAFYSSGTVGNVTGIVGRPSSQTDLSAANVKAGKTILGVTGTMTSGGSGYGINGTGILGASW
jgi:hypothetical protein